MERAAGLDWLYALQHFGIKLGLHNIRELLSRLGNPHHGLSCAHVAGTNGKGSVTAMVHAGLLPQWSIDEALLLGKEVEAALAARAYREFLANLYGSQPDRWSDALAGWDRLRVIVNAMTRLRFCTPQGRMDFRAKGKAAPAGHVPWFDLRSDARTIVCGHWSALGLKLRRKLAALDSGCVWGGMLSAMRLEDRALFQVPCAGYGTPGGE